MDHQAKSRSKGWLSLSSSDLTTETVEEEKLFLERLEKSFKTCGIFLFRRFLTPEEAGYSLSVLDSEQFPWDLKPRIDSSSLPQHAYHHNRSSLNLKRIDKVGLSQLELICEKIETEFDGTITDVYCNRFEDPKHRVEWHKDNYNRHVFVLTLGAQRNVQFRNNKTRDVREVAPRSGDLYFMPLAMNSTHKYRICSAGEKNGVYGTRLSFSFVFKAPLYAREYRITKKEKVYRLIQRSITA